MPKTPQLTHDRGRPHFQPRENYGLGHHTHLQTLPVHAVGHSLNTPTESHHLLKWDKTLWFTNTLLPGTVPWDTVCEHQKQDWRHGTPKWSPTCARDVDTASALIIETSKPLKATLALHTVTATQTECLEEQGPDSESFKLVTPKWCRNQKQEWIFEFEFNAVGVLSMKLWLGQLFFLGDSKTYSNIYLSTAFLVIKLHYWKCM